MEISTIYITNKNITTVKRFPDIPADNTYDYYLYLYTTDFDSNISNVFVIKENYNMFLNGMSNAKINIANIYYPETQYFGEINDFLNSTIIYNPTNSQHGNYIMNDYILTVEDYIKTTTSIYISKKYNYPVTDKTYISLDNNILYRYVIDGYLKLLVNVDNRIKELVDQKITESAVYQLFLSDYEYLIDGIKLTSYFYDTLVNEFFNKYMINGYYYFNSFKDYNSFSTNIIPQYSSFSQFINNIIDNDSILTTTHGILLKTYLYYNYGNQLLCPFTSNANVLTSSSIRDTQFDYSNIQILTNKLSNNTVYATYDVNNIVSFLKEVQSNQFNIKNFQYKMNPHLYYSYLNLGYIENLLSLNLYGNIDFNIKNYTNFEYSDIDNLISNVAKFYTGNTTIPTLANIIINVSTNSNIYANIIGYTTITDNLLKNSGNITNYYMNDLVTISNNRIPDSTVSQQHINLCNKVASDVKVLIKYFNDYVENIQTLRYILLNDVSITENQLYLNLNLPNFSSFAAKNVNDYKLQYFSSNDMYSVLNTYRTTYTYDDLLIAFDNDTQNYYDYLVSINNTTQIGSSMKDITDKTAILYSNADIYKLINTRNSFGKIEIPDLSNIKATLINSKDQFVIYYNEYLNNRKILDIKDDIELKTFNNTIKNINISSGSYVPSLSSMNQFDVFNRKYFGYIVDKENDYVYDTSKNTHSLFKATSSNIISNNDYFNIPVLDTISYDNYRKTYEYQLKRIQSYFFNKVHNNDLDLNYLKPFYALENNDMYRLNPILIQQTNKFYNYDIPEYVSANIITLNKLDNNYNTLDYNVKRIMENSVYYIETLKILDNYLQNNFTNDNVSYMKQFLGNSIVYLNYTTNSDEGSIKVQNKSPYSLLNWGNISFISFIIST